jgi:hypothetical protein
MLKKLEPAILRRREAAHPVWSAQINRQWAEFERFHR